MQANVTLEQQDIAALGRLLRHDEDRARKQRLAHIGRRAVFMLAMLVVAVMLFAQGDRQGVAVRVVGAFLGFMGLYVALVHFLGSRASSRRIAQVEADNHAALGQRRTYALTEEGIRSQDSGREDLVAWESIGDVVEEDDRLFVFIRGRLPLIFPHRSFHSTTEARQFAGLVRDYVDRRHALRTE